VRAPRRVLRTSSLLFSALQPVDPIRAEAIGGRIRLPRRHFFRRHRPRIHIDRDRHAAIARLRLKVFLFSKNSKNRKKHVLFTLTSYVFYHLS